MLDQWNQQHVETVAVTAVLAGSVSLMLAGYRLTRRRKSRGCLPSLLGAGCCGGLGTSAGIVAAASVVESLSPWGTLVVGVLLSVSVDVTTAAGWSTLRRTLLAAGRSALRELEQDRQSSDEPTSDGPE